MKKRTYFFLLLFGSVFISICSTNKLNSEEYICSASLVDFDKPREVETKTYKRDGNLFLKTHQYGEDYFSILKENNEFIVLTKTYDYPDVFITIINKNKKTFYENYLSTLTPTLAKESAKPLVGKCIISR